MEKKKVLVWLSWWVDSAVCAYLLKEAWYEVYAGFMVNYLAPEWEYCPTKEDLEEARKVSDFLWLKDFFTFNYVDTYADKVLKYMYDWYKAWVTPNPDIMCNKEVKFKVFLEEAMEAWFDYVAMGHYARIEEDNKNVFHLLKWVDDNKDQTYFLSWLSQYQLSKALFPIGHLEKLKVREIAEKIGLPNAKRKDSQGICFVWKVDMSKFLEKEIPNKEGEIIDMKWKVLWKHKWIFYYTIGQRKGLWIWGGPAIYVVKKDIENNKIIVWWEDELAMFSKEVFVSNISFLADKIDMPFSAKAKLRYRQKDEKCEVISLWKNRVKLIFDNSQRAVTSGQMACVYIWDELVLSWIIE